MATVPSATSLPTRVDRGQAIPRAAEIRISCCPSLSCAAVSRDDTGASDSTTISTSSPGHSRNGRSPRGVLEHHVLPAALGDLLPAP